MRRQLSALLWRVLAPTLEVAREEGREEVRGAVRGVLADYAPDPDASSPVPADRIRRALSPP